jgi:hypothetical protein
VGGGRTGRGIHHARQSERYRFDHHRKRLVDSAAERAAEQGHRRRVLQAAVPGYEQLPGQQDHDRLLNGVPGISWELCFTLTSGAQSLPAAALLFVGANPIGSVYYAMYMLTAASNMPAFSNECGPILKGIQWKLK